MLRYSFLASALLLVTSQVRAANDWSKPCFQGDCSYDVAGTDSSVPGTVRIWGNSNAISDITESAGWLVWGCQSNTTDTQAIQAICKSTDTSAAGCDHLDQNGAVDTIVRLPQSCMSGPFARVVKSETSQNQTVPAAIAAKMESTPKRSSTAVRTITLDTNWRQNRVPHGPVNFAVVGLSTSDPASSISIPKQNARRATAKRFSLGSFDEHPTKQIPINIQKDIPILSKTATCAGFGDISLDVDANIGVTGSVDLGLLVQGSIIPPKISTFSLTSDLEADLGATLKLAADFTGEIDSGNIELFSVGLPGLDIPGILELGPTVSINGRATLNLNVDLDVTVGVNHHISSSFAFPPTKGAVSKGSSTPKDSPISLSLAPDVSAEGTVAVHVLPSVNFGLKALGGIAEAEVFLDIDAEATLDVTVDASANLGKTVGGSGAHSTAKAPPAKSSSKGKGVATSKPKSSAQPKAKATMTKAVGAKKTAAPKSTKKTAAPKSTPKKTTVVPKSTSKPKPVPKPAPSEGGKGKRGASAQISACVDISAGVSGNIGATGDLFGLFKDTKQTTLFSKNFDIFQKCFGAATKPKRRETNVPALASRAATTLEGRALSLKCPAAGTKKQSAPTKLVDQTIKAASIHPK